MSKQMELRIPDYRVDDQSYVSTFETDSRIQAALAQSSFSEVDVEAAAYVTQPDHHTSTGPLP